MGRTVAAFGGRGVIAAIGVGYVVLASGWALLRATGGEPGSNVVIAFTLTAGPGVLLLYGWYRVPRRGIHPDFYPLISGWCLGGIGVMATILFIYHVQPDDSLTNPYRSILTLSALASLAGLGVGFHDARARTSRRELERRNRELQRLREELEASNERLEQFAYAVSHDLQEPLRMVTSYLGMIEQRYADVLDEDGEEFIAFAVDGAERMREMVDGLLEYSRVETQGEPFEPVDLNEVVGEAQQNLELQITESSATIEIDTLPTVEGDQQQLRQVFQNLLRNAIVYSGDAPPRIHISAQRDDAEWIVSVSDEGIGIEPDDQERIFEVFQRLHTREEYEGTGIGLALCQRIVEYHGGRIWVDSAAGEGATFSFSFPAMEQ